MDTDDVGCRDYIPPALRFNKRTRQALARAFTVEFQKSARDCSSQEVEHEAEIFVRTLECYAAAIPEFKRVASPEQKRRREKVRALATTLEKLHRVLGDIDSAALGFAVWRGLKEIETRGMGANPLQPGMSAVVSVFNLRADTLPALAAFSGGVRFAVKQLPKDTASFMLSTALAVERLFYECRFPFTVSDSGFAAQCLREVFMLGGLKDVRVDYWLTLARDSDDAMVGMIKRIAKRQKNADE